MNSALRVQIVKEATDISLHTHTPRKGMNPSVLPPAMCK